MSAASSSRSKRSNRSSRQIVRQAPRVRISTLNIEHGTLNTFTGRRTCLSDPHPPICEKRWGSEPVSSGIVQRRDGTRPPCVVAENLFFHAIDPFPAAPARAALASALRDPAAAPSRVVVPAFSALACPLIDLFRLSYLRIVVLRAPGRDVAAACFCRRTASPRLGRKTIL